MILSLVIKVGQIFTAGLGVGLEVEVGAVGNTLDLPPAPGEGVLDV